MGIPSPLWTWVNDLIVIRRSLRISTTEFDKSLNELAVEIYEKGFDTRFQTAQLIPVFVNEIIVRFLYSVRRLIKYIQTSKNEQFLFSNAWAACEPFSNGTVKRMLTVAHGTFCCTDTGDTLIRGFVAGGGTINIGEFFLRLNIPGIGRFTISIYGEVKRAYKKERTKKDIYDFKREKEILEYYIEGLNELAEIYDDKSLLTFANDFKNSDAYFQAFEKTVLLAEKRGAPEEKILRTKSDIDAFFLGGDKYV